MSFTGNPGTGKTTLAMRMADILHRLGYVRSNHLVSGPRDDLVGQSSATPRPKTKEILKKAMGGVLFMTRPTISTARRTSATTDLEGRSRSALSGDGDRR